MLLGVINVFSLLVSWRDFQSNCINLCDFTRRTYDEKEKEDEESPHGDG